MSVISSVFIVEPADQGWIIERLMRDVAAELKARDITTRIGPSGDYGGEDVIFNSRFLTAFFDARAKVNSLFITHVDDKIKELQLKAGFRSFNSFVCMSAHEADFVAALGGSRAGVVGIDLPARDLNVRPTRLAMFSAFYEDGRKNESWIADYFRDTPASCKQNFVFCFMGWGWEAFCASLGRLEMNYEVYRYSRFTPGEYDLYKQVLSTMDCLVYLGFDGGAMSVYDGINAGIDVIAPNISYNRNLGDGVTLFDDKAGFFRELDRLGALVEERRETLRRRSVKAYTDALLAHWASLAGGDEPAPPENPPPLGVPEAAALDLFRTHYKPLGPSRLRSALIRAVQAFFISSRSSGVPTAARSGRAGALTYGRETKDPADPAAALPPTSGQGTSES